MELQISSPGLDLDDDDRELIEKSLRKIDRRLRNHDRVRTEVRINRGAAGDLSRKVTLEVDYGRNHLVATAEHAEGQQALNHARDEMIRQINDSKKRGGHSDYAKR
jgi:ribosome-associated translation inhibitor RaiA